MFFPRKEPTVLVAAGLEALCAGLNRPVVDIEGLPVGPARAVIALHGDVEGERLLLVALRSIEAGAVALFAFRGELNPDPRQAMDTALSFAEGMGFLFDEDLFESGRPRVAREALQLWCELVGEELPPELPVLHPPSELEVPVALDLEGEPLFDETAEVIDVELRREEGATRVASSHPPAAAAMPLSKFRGAKEIESGPPTASGPAHLGRIPIVRRRRRGDESTVPAFLRRLLASF